MRGGQSERLDEGVSDGCQGEWREKTNLHRGPSPLMAFERPISDDIKAYDRYNKRRRRRHQQVSRGRTHSTTAVVCVVLVVVVSGTFMLQWERVVVRHIPATQRRQSQTVNALSSAEGAVWSK